MSESIYRVKYVNKDGSAAFSLPFYYDRKKAQAEVDSMDFEEKGAYCHVVEFREVVE